MKTPAFWRHTSTLSTLLLPLSWAYDMASTFLRNTSRPVKLPVPVICVGNVTLGGSGKTPVALHIGHLLKKQNIKAFYLSRGYGGSLKGPTLVKIGKHTAAQVGDEPLLLAGVLPTVIAKNRLHGALYAIQKGAQAIIMDDGMQNNAIAKSLTLMVIDGSVGFGNRRIFPAGPLREDPELALNRTHAVIILNRTTQVPALPKDKPVLTARTIPSNDALALKGKKLIAFCGLAYPEKFFTTLTSMGAVVVEKVPFGDHHTYSKNDMRKLVLQASAQNAALITTAKDAVRLPEKFRDCAAVLDIALDFDNEPLLINILDYVLGQNAKN